MQIVIYMEIILCGGFYLYSKFFYTLRYIVRQHAYVIYDAIIYSKWPLLRLRPLPSNNELSTAKAHCGSKKGTHIIDNLLKAIDCTDA